MATVALMLDEDQHVKSTCLSFLSSASIRTTTVPFNEQQQAPKQHQHDTKHPAHCRAPFISLTKSPPQVMALPLSPPSSSFTNVGKVGVETVPQTVVSATSNTANEEELA